MIGLALQWAGCGLLAQDEILRGIRNGLNKEPGGDQWLVVLLGAITLLALLLLAKRFASREDSTKPAKRPDYLAAALGALDLTAQERQDVKRLALRARLAQPAAMLLSPHSLAHALERGCPDGQEAELQERLAALSIKLFGQPPPKWPPAGQHQPEQPSRPSRPAPARPAPPARSNLKGRH